MTDKQQPKALRIADALEMPMADFPTPTVLEARAAAELRRQHAELETLNLYKNMADEYGLSIFPDIAEMTTELETLRTGYAAARLEIESLKAQLAEHADELAVAYMCGASREKELAAPQTGAAYAALLDASVEPTPEQIMAAAKVIQSHDVPDDEPKWDELPDWQIKVWLEGAEKALKAALSVTAAAAQQAPAQASPVAAKPELGDYCANCGQSYGQHTGTNCPIGIASEWRPAAPAAVAGPDEIDRLRAALVYVAFALHDARQYMLAEGITLIDGDTVRVSRDGWTVEASSNPLRQPAPQSSPAAQGDENA